MDKTLLEDNGYRIWLKELKSGIRQSQIKASVRVNTSMMGLYWSIGADIVTRQAESVWGRRNFETPQQGFADGVP
jgi:hypothetical protein